jgi:hypothetical protein
MVNANVPWEMAVQNSGQSVEGRMRSTHYQYTPSRQERRTSTGVFTYQLHSSSHRAGLSPRPFGDYGNQEPNRQIDQDARVTTIDPWTW